MGQGDQNTHQPADAAPSPPTPARPGSLLRSRPLRLGLLLALVAGGLGLSLWLGRSTPTPPPEERAQAQGSSPSGDAGKNREDRGARETEQPRKKEQPSTLPPGHGAIPGHGSPLVKPKPVPDENFLESFQKTEADVIDDVRAATNAELEKEFQEVARSYERKAALQARLNAAETFTEEKLARMMEERSRLVKELNDSLPRLQKGLAAARKARPRDPVPTWLTGELLMMIGGEPALVLPYLEQAVAAKLDRARLYASLAHVYHAGNQFQKAHDAAVRAIERDPRGEDSWSAYAEAAITLERFAELLERLDRTFPKDPPEWARNLREGTEAAQKRWQKEQDLRRAEEKANDLPRVRLTIEHRRFARDAEGKTLSKIESTGKGEVVVELFEDQAPASVASFLTLVEQGFYNGTRFHLARPAGEIVGGDPKTRKNDPSQDGSGGPGYTIPDEYDGPQARLHFRGSLGMANAGQPGTAGSQFYLTSAAVPELDGHYTVFGRVVSGQDVVDGITLGRTNLNVGQGGKVVPGDLLVRAEVVRKRPHEYRVHKRPAR